MELNNSYEIENCLTFSHRIPRMLCKLFDEREFFLCYIHQDIDFQIKCYIIKFIFILTLKIA